MRSRKKSSERGFSSFLILTLIALIFAGTSFLIAEKAKPEPIISPLVPMIPRVLPAQHQLVSKKEVIGFLPFWTIKEEANFRYSLLTQIIYMGVEFDHRGEILKTRDGYLEPSWSHFNSERLSTVIRRAKESGTRVLLGIQSYNNEAIEMIINQPFRRKKVIQQTINLMEQKNLDGLNIDFEHGGVSPSFALVQNYTQFVQELTEAVKAKSADKIVSLDVYADSANRQRIYQIEVLGQIVDQIIVMGYDFHRPSSISAGPVAPLRSSIPESRHNLTSALADFYQIVPREKLILAVPYYGYEWQTTSKDFGALAYQNSGVLATYKRTMELIGNQETELRWDNHSLTPWLIYQDNGTIKQIYFDNPRSLDYKYETVNQAEMGGIAIWALGYDGQRTELWDLLKEKFHSKVEI
jgi:spore germination protein YaaH